MEQASAAIVEVQSLIVLVSLVFFILVLTIVSLITYFRKKKTEYVLERERAEAEFENTLAIAKEEIVELLSVASMELNMVKEKSTENLPELKEVSSLISKSLTEIRSLSRTLNSESISNQGLKRSLEIELERLNKIGLIETVLSVDENFSLGKNNEIIIFRMLQEFIVNTLKHANATQLRISIKKDNKLIKIEATDNGKGFDLKNVVVNNGLTHLRGRAKMIGAKFDYYSKVGDGTRMEIMINQK